MLDDRRRYRKIFIRLWKNREFRAMSEGEKLMAIYLLTGPQTNRLGLFHVSCGLGTEDLGCTVSQFTKRLESVCRAFGWHVDKAVNVVWVPSWWNFNDVRENFKVMQGALADLHEVPETSLIDRFLTHLAHVPQGLHYLFEGLSAKRAIPRTFSNSGIQEQEQEQEKEQEQEQDSRALTRPERSHETEFEIFRNAYPAARRVGGKEGRRAFAGALNGRDPSAHLAVMLAALEQHQRSEQWQNPKYIPLMTTWLNQERWTMTLPVAGVMGQSVKTAGNQSAIEQFVARRQGGAS